VAAKSPGITTDQLTMIASLIPISALIIQPIVAAAGYSLLYLLLGGGLGGAFLIFIIAKMVGK
jgi:hypothetical protein